MDQKNEYQQKMEARLDEWRAEIDKLQSKAASAKEDTQKAIEKNLDSLRDQMNSARARLEELGKASEHAWKDLRTGVDRAMDDLKTAVERAVDRVS